MIPKFTQSGVLPPFLSGDSPVNRHTTSPYKASLVGFVTRFNTSEKRRKILLGFLKYRRLLKDRGITEGFQWIDGSFIEDVEFTQKRDPNDIDVVTFFARPDDVKEKEHWRQFVKENEFVFNTPKLRQELLCDAYVVDLDLPPHVLVENTKYWYGLFSHKKDTYLWKGMVEVALIDDEADAFTLLGESIDAT